ncbi:MAG: NAD(P)H-hydrate epimerase [Alphaproteobacteria bacterium]|nr:NAD(P)H-hydrate epimerase [Alphaproteobacteria bacterium]MBP7760120.1 NAD(P)H-hydrate epimerase [Alphaproteobacteria bacterium]MBP7763489.1 NAD(P)H-hydrate epimerase [Alphaproteobacteria bacterium]MBP7905992.1 NAD(P)H-hydrate epimerase [Alphaproteobacteria bacterium]
MSNMTRPHIPQEIVTFLQSITIAELGYISQADYGWKAEQHYEALKQIIFEQNCRVDESQNWYPGEVVNLCSCDSKTIFIRAYVMCLLLISYGGGDACERFYKTFRESVLRDISDIPQHYVSFVCDALLINFDTDFFRKHREILTNAQMAEADRSTIESGVPGFTLMQNAGQAVADIIIERVQPCKTLVLCGPGNNGGDGFVIAALLKAQGWEVAVASCVPLETLKGDAKMAADLWSGEVLRFEDIEITSDLLVVDAVFGTGFRGEFRSPVLEVFQKMEKAKPLVIAVDIPSGVNGTTGAAASFCPEAKLTVTFCRKKLGHVLSPGSAHCGHVVVADIGIPDSSVAQAGFAALENSFIPPKITLRELNEMAEMRALHKRLVQFAETNQSITDPLAFLRERAEQGKCFVMQTKPDFILATPEGEVLITPHAPEKARKKEIEARIENLISGLVERKFSVREAACAALYHLAHMGG